MKPTVAEFTGDPAGIGPELVEKLLHDPGTLARANVLLIGQRNELHTPDGVQWHEWTGADALCGEVSTLTPAQFADLNRQEFERFGRLIGEAGIRLQ